VSEPPAVEFRGVSKRYGSVLALNEVSVTVERGCFLVLLGPSGSGKSTLIRCLAGIEDLTAGTIALGGTVVADPRRQLPPERRDLAMVFQDFALWPHMTVQQNVAFAMRRRRTSGEEARREAAAMLERVGLAPLRDRYPYELSGGEQQRVALARALVARPALLLFDEPLSSLDANLRERLRIEIATLVREAGASAVYITHDQTEALALGDQIGVLAAGQLLQHDSPESIYGAPADPFVARFTGVAGHLVGRSLGPVRGGPSLLRVAVATAAPGRYVEVLATPMSALAAGAAVQILLRAGAVRLCRPGAAAAALCGTIRDVAFRGRGYDYVVELGAGVQFTGLFHRRQHARGDQLGMHLDPAGCFAYPANSADPHETILAAESAITVVPRQDGVNLGAQRAALSGPATAARPDLNRGTEMTVHPHHPRAIR